MKKIFLFLFLLVNINSLSASITKLSLEISRSHNVDKSIKRVNNIYNFIELFILQTAQLPADFSALSAKYNGIINLGYTNAATIDFTISNNIVNFTGVVPNNLTDLSKQLYINNPNLNPNAQVNIGNLSIDIGLSSKSRGFLSKSLLIKGHDVTNILDIQDTAPTCANNTQLGHLWYRPDGDGKYFIYRCSLDAAIWQWIYTTNRLETAIYVNSVATLNTLNALTGTRAYVPFLANRVKEYIYAGDDGNPATNDWREVDTTP